MSEKGSLLTAQIIDNQNVAPAHFLMTVRLPFSFATPFPGQFVMIRNDECDGPLLARPFSVYGFQRQQDHVVMDLLYRVAGRGTSLFSRMLPGEELCIFGPLGKGFSVPIGVKRVLLVAGGVGVAPLIFLLHKGLLPADGKGIIETIFYLGARTAELLTGLERLCGFCDLKICTDDGSRGYHGPVTGLVKHDIRGFDAGDTVIYACGPKPMVRAMGNLLQGSPIHCQVSLEERMACGLGACLGCAVAVRTGEGKTDYRRVCQDGPVFNLRDIVFASPAGS